MKRFYRTLIVISCVAVLACDDEDTGDTQSDAGDTGTETGDTGGFRDADVTPDSVGDPTPDTTEDVVPDFVPDTADVSEDVVPDLPTEDLADGDVSDEEVGEPVNHGDDELDPTGGFWSESYIVSGALGDIGATVYASMLDENGHLIIGGEFEQVGAAPAANVARWDGETWTAMGDGLTIIVRDLVQGGTDVIYAAGAPGGCIGICGAGGIGIGGGSNTVKLWNDEAATWVDEGPALDGQIYALAMVDGDLWVGGSFAAAEDTNPANLAILSGGLGGRDRGGDSGHRAGAGRRRLHRRLHPVGRGADGQQHCRLLGRRVVEPGRRRLRERHCRSALQRHRPLRGRHIRRWRGRAVRR